MFKKRKFLIIKKTYKENLKNETSKSKLKIYLRFIYFVCGPNKSSGKDISYAEVGSSLGTAFSDKRFAQVKNFKIKIILFHLET